MSRYLLDIGLFLLPFAAFAIYLFLKDINPLTGASWTRRQLIVLTIIGIAFSVFVLEFLAKHAGQQLVGRREGVVTEPAK